MRKLKDKKMLVGEGAGFSVRYMCASAGDFDSVFGMVGSGPS
jgi:hypothetical protein